MLHKHMQIRRIKVRLLKSPVSSTSTCRKSILSQFASHHFHIFVPFNSILCFLFTFSHRAAVIQDSPRIPLYQCPYIFFIQILLHPLFRMLSLRTSLATVVHIRSQIMHAPVLQLLLAPLRCIIVPASSNRAVIHLNSGTSFNQLINPSFFT